MLDVFPVSLSVIMKSPERTRKRNRIAAYKNPILVRRSNQHHATTTRSLERAAKRIRNEQPWLTSLSRIDETEKVVVDDALKTDDWIIIEENVPSIPSTSSSFSRLFFMWRRKSTDA